MRLGVVASVIALSVLGGLAAAAFVVPSWRVEASAVSQGSPSQIWTWYADSQRTPNWDHLVVRRTMSGPFRGRTIGSNQGSGGPAFPWTFTDVVTDDHYTEVTRLPLATLTATHVLTPVENGTRIDHALIVAGPLAWLYWIALHRSFDDGIHAALHRLASGAAKSPPPDHRID